MKIAMTDEQVRRTKKALIETHALLSRELKYQPHNRNQDVINKYSAHIAKLQAMLDTCEWEAPNLG